MLVCCTPHAYSVTARSARPLVGCRGLFLASGVLPLHRSPHGLRWRLLLLRVRGCAAAATARTRPAPVCTLTLTDARIRVAAACPAFCAVQYASPLQPSPGGATPQAGHSRLTPPCSSRPRSGVCPRAATTDSSRPADGTRDGAECAAGGSEGAAGELRRPCGGLRPQPVHARRFGRVCGAAVVECVRVAIVCVCEKYRQLSRRVAPLCGVLWVLCASHLLS